MATLGILIPVALAAFLLAGAAQSLTGFGSSLVAAPLLALVVGTHTTVVAVTLVSVVLTGWASVRERAHVDVGAAVHLSVVGLIGLPIGLLLLTWATSDVLRVLMAVTVLAALLPIALRIRLPNNPMAMSVAGVTSGALLTSTGMNGPPLVLALVARDLEPRRFRSTLQHVLCFQDVAAVIGFVIVGALSRDAGVLAAAGVVASPLGWLLGDQLFHRISPVAFRRVLVAGLTASALMLITNR